MDINYHPSSASVYPANWDGSEFEKHKMNEFNRLNESVAYNKMRDTDNNKRFKFYTTSFKDLIDAQDKDKLNFFSIGTKEKLSDGNIDNYSSLVNGKDGGIQTKVRCKESNGQLPYLTTPYQGQLQHGDVQTEDSLRPEVEPKNRALLARDHEYEKRSFTIFTDNIPTPDALLSVESPISGFANGRVGIPSRFEKRYGSSDAHIKSTTQVNNGYYYN
jgi:hypothetical protein